MKPLKIKKNKNKKDLEHKNFTKFKLEKLYKIFLK